MLAGFLFKTKYLFLLKFSSKTDVRINLSKRHIANINTNMDFCLNLAYFHLLKDYYDKYIRHRSNN